MTDMIPADAVRDIIARHRDGASHRGGMILDDLKALLSAPPRPTLADMTEEERAACIRMQADTAGSEDTCVLLVIGTGSAKGVAKDGRVTTGSHECFTPRPDLPRLEWPDDTPTPTPATLTEGSEWGDIDALTTACKTSGRGQIVVVDCQGDVSVWSAVSGWWEAGLPSDGYEPFTILHAGKGGDQ